MILFPKDIEWGPPGMCLICESTPDRNFTKVVSCQKEFDPGRPGRLNGMKYICENCIRTAMVVFEWDTPEKVQDLKNELVNIKEELRLAQKDYLALTNYKEAVQGLNEIGFSFKETRRGVKTKAL